MEAMENRLRKRQTRPSAKRIARKASGAVVLVSVIALVFVGLALAGSSTEVLGYQIDFLGFQDNNNGTSTWSYAITASGDETAGLSHWVLGIDNCYSNPVIIEPYTTPTGAEFGCGTTYTCQESTCQGVEYVDPDPTTGVTGIKFEECSPQLEKDNPVTHIFQVTVTGVPNQGGDVQVGVKAGQPGATGWVTGPACGPNAITLQSLDARPRQALPVLDYWAPLASCFGSEVVGRSRLPILPAKPGTTSSQGTT